MLTKPLIKKVILGKQKYTITNIMMNLLIKYNYLFFCLPR